MCNAKVDSLEGWDVFACVCKRDIKREINIIEYAFA